MMLYADTEDEAIEFLQKFIDSATGAMPIMLAQKHMLMAQTERKH